MTGSHGSFFKEQFNLRTIISLIGRLEISVKSKVVLQIDFIGLHLKNWGGTGKCGLDKGRGAKDEVLLWDLYLGPCSYGRLV